MKTLIILFCLTCFTKHVWAQPGQPDSSFGNNGIQTTGIKVNVLQEKPKKILPLSDGSFFEVITTWNYGSKANSYLVKYLMNGRVDSSYGNNGFSAFADFEANDAVFDSEGNIIIAGFSDDAFLVSRFLSDGFYDKSFGNNGIQKTLLYGLYTPVYHQSVAIQNDKIIVAGNKENLHIGDQWNFVIIRYNHDGSLDNSFGNNGIQTTRFEDYSYANALLIQGDKILIGGQITTDSVAGFALTRYNYDGSLDKSFGAGGFQATGFENGATLTALVKQGDKIVAGGSSFGQFVIARYNPDGSPDNSFSSDGKLITPLNLNNYPYLTNLAIQGDKIIASGSATIRYNSDGSTDSSFNDGEILYSAVNTMAATSEKIITAVQTYSYSNGMSKYDIATAIYNIDGTPDDRFGNNGILIDFYPYSRVSATSIAVQQDGKIIVVGNAFTGTESPNDDFIVFRYNVDGSLDNSFSEDGIQTTDFGQSNDYAYAVAFQGNKIIVAGATHKLDNYDDNFCLARYNADGSLDTSFGIGGKQVSSFGRSLDYANAIAIQGNKIIVAGYSNGVNGTGFAIARYNEDGSPDSSFGTGGLVLAHIGPGTDDIAEAVGIQGDKIVAAGRSQVHGTGSNNSTFAIIRFNEDGSPDNSFGQEGKVTTSFGFYNETYCKSLLIQGSKITATGLGFGKNPGGFAVARYNLDGSLDKTFHEDGLLENEFPRININSSPTLKTAVSDSNGNILVAGSNFSQVNNASTFAIARYKPDGNLDSSFGLNGLQITGVNSFAADAENIFEGNNRLYAIGILQLNQFQVKAMIVAYQLDEMSTTITCPPDTSAFTGKGSCSALMNGIDPVLTGGNPTSIIYSITGATTLNGNRTASGNLFNKGESVVTYSVADNAVCHFKVMVVDKEPPVITNISASPDVLWPPNNKMKDVIISYTTSDNCGSVTSGLSVTDNDNNSYSKKGKSPLWEIVDSSHVRLLAEKSKEKNSRIYTITISATDADGNISRQQVQVKVPHAEPQTNNKTVINVNSNDLSILATPNPSQQDFTLKISSNNNQVISLVILDASGRLIESVQKINPNTSLILGSKYNPGIYYAELMQGNHKKIIKLVKL